MEAQVAVTTPLAESALSSFVTSGNVSMGGVTAPAAAGLMPRSHEALKPRAKLIIARGRFAVPMELN